MAPELEKHLLRTVLPVLLFFRAVLRFLGGFISPEAYIVSIKASSPKDGKTYAQVGDRLYTEHAVNRMQPSGMGTPAGKIGTGRNISPSIVNEVIRSGQPTSSVIKVVPRTEYWSGNDGVITEGSGRVVVTILRRSSK